jgi:hydroxymethylglutaryl-CoA lyase
MTSDKVAVKIVEVGLRDGLQNESVMLDVDTRHQLLHRLSRSGLRCIEVGSFVSPKWVPAMAPSEELFRRALQDQRQGLLPAALSISGLVPNEKGMELALRLGVKDIALFAACSESFSQKNTNCSIAESFDRLRAVAHLAVKNQMQIRGYLSTCFGCPFEGAVAIETVADNVQRMLDLGVYEISLGDTIGLAGAGDVERLLSRLLARFPASILAGHFHDTRGQATANVLQAYQMGLTVFDASIGGLGGCPYAPGATGNVATEDVIYLFRSLGVDTGVELSELLEVNQWLSRAMNKPLPSRVGLASQSRTSADKVCFL